MACAEHIACIAEALPDVTFGSPLPAFTQLAGGDINFANVGGDLNLPFGRDFLDITSNDDYSTHDSHDKTTTVSDFLNDKSSTTETTQLDFLNPTISAVAPE